ncbi:MAG: replication-relaxation family protein [Roseiflexaceae bacterium]
MSPEHPRAAADIGPIPFFDGADRHDGEIDVRLALEVDKGTEELKVLLEKAAKYRDLHKAGIYTATLGGPVLPLFLVQTPRRAAQIAKEFQDIWPSGWGVAGTPFSANSRDSVWWGKYKSPATAQPFELLTHMVVDREGRVQFFPAISREEWQSGVVVRAAPLTAQQANGRAGGQERVRRARARKEASAAE